MAENPENIFFVGIKNPIEVRRGLLEASKGMVQSLQRYERFKTLRAEKAKEILKVRSIMVELDRLMGKLKVELPKTNLRVKAITHPKKKVEVRKEEEKLEKKPKHVTKHIKKAEDKPEEQLKKLTEVDQLEAELNEIESKLNSIS